MPTAIFNTKIETPASGSQMRYDLNSVITKYGFGDAREFKYTLQSKQNGVLLSDNLLTINANAYGAISIEVATNTLKATAATKLYGFYATRLEIINTAETARAFERGLSVAKQNWPTLVGN